MKKKFVLICTGIVFFLNACSKDDTPSSAILATPVANPATEITDASFKAKWNFVSSAQNYLLDVSLSPDFTDFVTNYNAKSVNDLNDIVMNLTGGTQYYYRVRAARGTEISNYSNVISVITSGTFVNPDTPLKVKAANNFFVGAAVSSSRLSGAYNTLITTEFSSITAENEMKMEAIFTGPGTYNWTQADAIVDYAVANNINVHGHALVWHGSVPSWMNSYTGTDAEFEQLVHDYITAVVTRYVGKVTSWDVVNEAINDGGGTRNTIFLQKMGANYIAKCFQWAREADPNVLLFYNDYNTSTDISKQNDVYALIDNLKANNVPIDGVGLQMHIKYDSPTRQELQTDVDKVLARNLKLHFSELDVRANSNDSQVLNTLTPERKSAQKMKYREVVEVYNAIPTTYKYAITVWGIKDNESWILNQFNRVDWPLLFDNSFNRKVTHTGFLEGLE